MRMVAKVEKDIKRYWDTRASENSNSPQATTNDVYLRKLEVSSIVDTLKDLALAEDSTVLDVGCGDGYTTLHVAERLGHLRFLGVDYSENMIRTASLRLAAHPGTSERVAFKVGDATNLKEVCGNQTYDVVTSDRCLINLTSLESQTQAIAQIAEHINPDGYYVAVENFVEGHENMNTMRRAMGLPDIPVRWHNLFFKENDFLAAAEPFFDLVAFKDFSSSYYFATRVIYSAMCQLRGEQPDYEHDIHRLAVDLPWSGQHSPIRLGLLRRKRCLAS